MSHRIFFVDDDALPEGHDFLLLSCPSGNVRLFYRRSAVTPETLEDSWAAYRAVAHRDPSAPTRRTEPSTLQLVS